MNAWWSVQHDGGCAPDLYTRRVPGLGTPNPVLMDVFYIVTQTDAQTKQSSNVLVKRGREFHGPPTINRTWRRPRPKRRTASRTYLESGGAMPADTA